MVALDGMLKAVPRRADTLAYHHVTRVARTALEASDEAALTDLQWRYVNDVLSAMVPDLQGRRARKMSAGQWLVR